MWHINANYDRNKRWKSNKGVEMMDKDFKPVKISADSYQKQAWDTALYPNKGSNLYYPSLGLGESGEVQIYYLNNQKIDKNEVCKELGDILWYIAALHTEMGLKMSDTFGPCFEQYQINLWNTISYDKKGKNQLHCVLGLGRSGEIQNIVKKIMRDDSGVLRDDKKGKIVENLKELMKFVSLLCSELEVELIDVAQKNIDKLNSRKDRGVITGSGDNR